MTDDRTLLELAAKAAGIDGEWDDAYRMFVTIRHDDDVVAAVGWFPLADDGDALRLAVKLGLSLQNFDFDGGMSVATWEDADGWYPVEEPHEGDPFAATRRAIVRAAAAIGEQK